MSTEPDVMLLCSGTAPAGRHRGRVRGCLGRLQRELRPVQQRSAAGRPHAGSRTIIAIRALLAPILVPMLMQLGLSPELTQAAYRVGDPTTNILTPVMPYFPLVVVVPDLHGACS